jgi:hypothetical protein
MDKEQVRKLFELTDREAEAWAAYITALEDTKKGDLTDERVMTYARKLREITDKYPDVLKGAMLKPMLERIGLWPKEGK